MHKCAMGLFAWDGRHTAIIPVTLRYHHTMIDICNHYEINVDNNMV
jgi:hypothetical protein